MFETIISATNDALYSWVLIIILVAGGLYFTFRTKFAQFRLFREQLRILMRYYDGGQWLRDYELDEQGLIPKDLKRGVLSQDGLYNLLCAIKQ